MPSLFVLTDFIVYMHLFLLYKIFISMYVIIQVQVKFKKSNVAGPCKYWKLGEKLAFISFFAY